MGGVSSLFHGNLRSRFREKLASVGPSAQLLTLGFFASSPLSVKHIRHLSWEDIDWQYKPVLTDLALEPHNSAAVTRDLKVRISPGLSSDS